MTGYKDGQHVSPLSPAIQKFSQSVQSFTGDAFFHVANVRLLVVLYNINVVISLQHTNETVPANSNVTCIHNN